MAQRREEKGQYLRKTDIAANQHRDVVIANVTVEHFDANKYGDARDAEVIHFEGTSVRWAPNNTSWNMLLDLMIAELGPDNGMNEDYWVGKTIRITRGCRYRDDLPDGLYCAESLPEQKPTTMKPRAQINNPGDTTHPVQDDPFKGAV